MSLPPLPPGAELIDDSRETLPPLPEGAELLEEAPPDSHVTSAPRSLELEAAKRKEAVLGNIVTFFGNGGPTAIAAGTTAAMQWPGPRARAGEGPIDLYRRVRDETGKSLSLAERQGPQVEAGGMRFNPVALAGAAAPSLLAPNPVGALGRMGLSGLVGAEQAFVRSPGDLTNGEVGSVMGDTIKGAGFGLGAAGLAEGVAAPFRFVAGRAGKEAGLAADEVVAAGQRTADKGVQSAAGVKGGVVSGGSNSDKYMRDVLENPGNYSPAVVAQIQALVDEPGSVAIRDAIALAQTQKFKEFIPRLGSADAALSSAQSAAAPSAVAAAAAAKMDPRAVVSDMAGKFGRSVGQRAAMGVAGAAAGSGLGMLTGQDPKVSGGLGLLGAGAGYSTPGTLAFLRNQATSPVVQNFMNRGAQAAVGVGASGVAKVGMGAGALKPELDQEQEDAITAFLDSR